MATFQNIEIINKNKENINNALNTGIGIQEQTISFDKMEKEKMVNFNNDFNRGINTTNLLNNNNNSIIRKEQNINNENTNVFNNNIMNVKHKTINIPLPSTNEESEYFLKQKDINTDNDSKENVENNYLQTSNKNGNVSLKNKLNFNSSMKIQKSLTEQLCEEISMKLGKIFLCKSYLETYIFEKNPYLMNFVYLKDDMSESKNRILNSLLLSSFCNLIWNKHIYKHEYLLSKEILNKYFEAIVKNPDKNNYCIVPIYDLNKIQMVLNEQENNIKLLKKKKIYIKKTNENLLFILNIIKNNFLEIKTKTQRIIQRLLFKLDILDKLYILKNNSAFFSNKYEFNKYKLIEVLEFFNSFNIDNQIQKINQNISELVKEKKQIQNFLYSDNEFTSNLKNNIAKNEQDITELKSTTSEICINLEENKEYLYQFSEFEREENCEIF
ncbi:conserved protein, unknown function [Hepatocystis sp. ex Piliocolobus tephrosceles]|nr:conserved protein, unknown function [Hepatocystis sp. ex Piliocolobus tephrosceles]